MAPPTSSMNVGTDRSGSDVTKNVIQCSRTSGMLQHPELFIAASGRRNYFLPEAALSKPNFRFESAAARTYRPVKHFRQNGHFFFMTKNAKL
jgi:hypothetical protein